jgi:UDP-N-acetylglucosamine 1-carboxyvinyltransferase
MSKLVIRGGRKLRGAIGVQGSKNAVLPILAACLLNSGVSTIENCPKLKDVEVALDILKSVGCEVKFGDHTAVVDASVINKTDIPEELAAEMRSSIIFLGAMLARKGRVTISYPGGCGTRMAHIHMAHNI